MTRVWTRSLHCKPNRSSSADCCSMERKVVRIPECDPRSRVEVWHSINLIRTLSRRLYYTERSDLLGAATDPVLRPLVGPQTFVEVGLAILSRTCGWMDCLL